MKLMNVDDLNKWIKLLSVGGKISLRENDEVMNSYYLTEED